MTVEAIRLPQTTEVDEKRVARAQLEFSKLPVNLQARLIVAADKSDMVRRRLAAGKWFELVRALNGLHIQQPDGGYRLLAEEFNNHLKR